MSNWHPTNDQLLEFASGTGSSAMSIAISTHLHFCQACRHQVHDNESMAAVLFEEQTRADLAGDGFDRLMSRIQNEPTVSAPKAPKAPSRFPPVIEKLIHKDTESLDWRSPMKNLRVSQLLKDETGLILGLHHMKSGGRVPHHTHRGNEISVVIEGGFSDEMGSYGPGDFIHLAGEHFHSPQADADGDCWLLSLVEAPVKLTGPLGWLVNPFLKP
ncbi:ChrR family anti-sigma-E factor [Reinekea blandensis]|uniref:Anti-sigma factor n=1 Tax=Reinekea blandensis MED297 TaxID=314283 RepID=A4BC70_9GAMM|nr:ChrR family anti-sigma-E factor [Reinekea blandensis]EAR10136.1 Anti-sigma factor [Reinekea sp. MED297] [Reinekea blandensis MED297]